LHFPARATAAVRANARTSYGYDPASRLTSLSHDLAGSANDLTLTFTHNPAGQIHSRTGSNDAYSWTGHGSGSTASAANGLNQIVDEGGTALAHDANGNMTYDGVRSYAYAADNRMIAAGSTNLDYNPLGQLLRAGDDMVDIDYVGEGSSSNAMAAISSSAIMCTARASTSLCYGPKAAPTAKIAATSTPTSAARS